MFKAMGTCWAGESPADGDNTTKQIEIELEILIGPHHPNVVQSESLLPVPTQLKQSNACSRADSD